MWAGWSAERTLTGRQRTVVLALTALTVLATYRFGPTAVGATVLSVVTLVFVATTFLRLRYMLRGARDPAPPPARPSAGRSLPRYSVMVALYREAAVVPALLDSLASLDYPAEKLQVLLLVEEDDPGTAQACREGLRPGWEVLVVPPGVPKTKPRALNAGLPLLTGKYFTIYDAEDRPEPDQLIKAVQEFRRSPDTVVSLQARLDFYNSHQNLLTKWFTCDYATHFGLYVAGIASYGHPVPLGGTSTHFRTSPIRELGGWDSWNVTEDCELGMRLAAAGYETRTLASTTWEEAVPQVRPWIKQRSRWVKGYTQTALVMLRAPLRTGAAMGWRRYAAALGIVAGLPVILTTQLLSWALLLAYIVLRSLGANVEPIEALFPEPLLSLAMVSLLVGNIAVLLAQVSEIYHEERYDLVGHAVLLPAYWLLTSIGAWRGVVQLVWRPHFWEKTQHGLSAQPQPVPLRPQPSPVPSLPAVAASVRAAAAPPAPAQALALKIDVDFDSRRRRVRPRAVLVLVIATGAFLGGYAGGAATDDAGTNENATAAGAPPKRLSAGPVAAPVPTIARAARVPALRALRRIRRVAPPPPHPPRAVSRRAPARAPVRRALPQPQAEPKPQPPPERFFDIE